MFSACMLQEQLFTRTCKLVQSNNPSFLKFIYTTIVLKSAAILPNNLLFYIRFLYLDRFFEIPHFDCHTYILKVDNSSFHDQKTYPILFLRNNYLGAYKPSIA